MSTPAAATIIMMRGWTRYRRAEAMGWLQSRSTTRWQSEWRLVDEGGQNASALIAKVRSGVGGAGLKVDRGKAEQKRQKIRGVGGRPRRAGRGSGRAGPQ